MSSFSGRTFQRKKPTDGHRNGFDAKRRDVGFGGRSTQPCKKGDNFMQTYSKPAQIYRYISQHKSSVFLNRTLSYMRDRMSRTNQRRTVFKVDSIMDRVIHEINSQCEAERQNLMLNITSLEDPSSNLHWKPVEISVIIQVIGIQRQFRRSPFDCRSSAVDNEVRKPLLTIEKKMPVTSKYCDEKNMGVNVKIVRDIFPKMSREYVMCLLTVTVKPSYDLVPDHKTQDKRRKKSDPIPPDHEFKNEFIIFNSRMECHLKDGIYQIVPKIQEKLVMSREKKSGDEAAFADATRTSVKTGLEVSMRVSWKDNPKSATCPSNCLMSMDEKTMDKKTRQDQQPIEMVYKFFGGNEYQETVMKNLRCPWCDLNCMKIKSLIAHLRFVHFRFNYRFLRESATEYHIHVLPNESFDGSYSGNPQDLSNVSSVTKFFGRSGPHRRTPVTTVLFMRKALPPGTSLDPEDDETDDVRPVVHGHDRLYYHTNTNTPIRPQDMDIDSEDENDPQWMKAKTQQMIDEFTDVNEGEKEVMKLWNLHIMKYGFTGDCQMPEACRMFLQEKGEVLREKNLRYNFILHLMCLYDYGLIDAVEQANLIRDLNLIFNRPSKDHSLISSTITNGFNFFRVS